MDRHSNRAGSLQVWAVRPDGSGLRAITAAPERLIFPIWSPDGSHREFSQFVVQPSAVRRAAPIDKSAPSHYPVQS